jgi:hypothetical protein
MHADRAGAIGSEPTAFEEEAGRIRRGLSEFDSSVVREAPFQPVRLIVRDEADELIGGLVGDTTGVGSTSRCCG